MQILPYAATILLPAIRCGIHNTTNDVNHDIIVISMCDICVCPAKPEKRVTLSATVHNITQAWMSNIYQLYRIFRVQSNYIVKLRIFADGIPRSCVMLSMLVSLLAFVPFVL